MHIKYTFNQTVDINIVYRYKVSSFVSISVLFQVLFTVNTSLLLYTSVYL